MEAALSRLRLAHPYTYPRLRLAHVPTSQTSTTHTHTHMQQVWLQSHGVGSYSLGCGVLWGYDPAGGTPPFIYVHIKVRCMRKGL